VKITVAEPAPFLHEVWKALRRMYYPWFTPPPRDGEMYMEWEAWTADDVACLRFRGPLRPADRDALFADMHELISKYLARRDRQGAPP
jgi:hypothetical protein